MTSWTGATRYRVTVTSPDGAIVFYDHEFADRDEAQRQFEYLQRNLRDGRTAHIELVTR